ncbi:MAG: DUF5050 domain-containing protein [Candidatus Poribacteria bacterium]|nr:DUF5050 domain-containing protein [Candidatus Poribacteria bacterium]
MKARYIFLILLIVFIACDDRQKPMRNIIRAPVSTGAGTYLVLDSDNPPIYWAAYDFRSNPFSRKIQRLDGTNLQDIISDFAPNTFVTIRAVDVEGGKIYYRTQNHSEHKAYRANLDGSNIQMLSETNVSSLVVHGGKIYWAGWTNTALEIYRANLDGSNIRTVVQAVTPNARFSESNLHVVPPHDTTLEAK